MFTNRPAMNQTTPQNTTEQNETFSELEKDYYHIRDAVQHRLLSSVNGDLALTDSKRVKELIEQNFNETLEEENLFFNRTVRTKLLDWVTADIVGYGPIEPLLNDPEITEVMVNGFDEVFVERFGQIEATNIKFEDESHLRRVIDRIVSPIGRRVDESSPMVDARLPNGFRVNATIPPLSLDGPILTIRKFAVRPFTARI